MARSRPVSVPSRWFRAVETPGPEAGSVERVTGLDDEQARRAAAFGAQAAAYARGRPGYPAAALRYCLGEDARRVLDLGAGTGKLTEGLLELGLSVVAVEPSAEMRALIPSAADALAGAAEAIPLEDASVDAVLVGQAFHWFERERALAEIARVLRPGGTVGLLWNRIRRGAPWVEEIARLMREASHTVEIEAPWSGRDDLSDPQWRTFIHGHETDAAAPGGQRRLPQHGHPHVAAGTPGGAPAGARARPAGRFRLTLECGVWRGERSVRALGRRARPSGTASSCPSFDRT